MLTRAEFEELRRQKALGMAADDALQAKALDVLAHGIKHSWLGQASWMGEPILQLPQDLFAIQEIIYATRPDFVVEVGVAWAGSLLFYSTLLAGMGKGRVIGIDLFLPPDLRERISKAGAISDRITLVEGSSLDRKILDQVEKLLGGSRKTLVHLDSNHTHDHVLRELNLYCGLVGPGYYLLCGDTHVELLPKGTYEMKPYDVGNNPKTALDEFLLSEDGGKFEVDRQFENKYLFSLNPAGYLRRRAK